MRTISIFLLGLVCVTLAAQQQKAGEAASWPVVFSDNFARTDVIGADWVVKGGKWDVRSEMKGTGPGAVLMCTRRFQAPFRIEYLCSADDPGDLSLEFRARIDDKTICFVGFGSENNTKNTVFVPGEGKVAASTENVIEPGRRHKVTVEVTDTTISQQIDGKATVKANVNFPAKGMFFGFYVWNAGAFSNVKVFSPNKADTAPTEAPKIAVPAKEQSPVREFTSFEDWALGLPPAHKCGVKRGEGASVKIADLPTWLYYNIKSEYRNYKENEDPAKADAIMKSAPNKGCRFVSDHCLELSSGSDGAGKQAAATLKLPPMREGLVEFDIMADHYQGEALRVRLGTKAALLIDKDGSFLWEANGKAHKLTSRIKYPTIGESARFYFWPQRWYTVRIDFDISMSLANVAIVNLYNEKRDKLPALFFPLGDDLPLPMDTVPDITFETAGPGRFYVDNLFVISRTADLADDNKWKVPAREITPVFYHLRKDPINLNTYSLRNVRYQFGSGCPAGDEQDDLVKKPENFPVILESAKKYNKALIEQAFLSERMRGLERAWFYAAAKPETTAKHAALMDQARKSTAETEGLLAQLYRFYADCYLDGLNQKKMTEGFDQRLNELKAAISRTNTLIRQTQSGLLGRTLNPEEESIACRYDLKTNAEPPVFSDGAFQRDGKRSFLFLRYASMHWKYMEQDLLLDDVGGLGSSHLAWSAKEPDFCDPSKDTWFHTCATRDPTEKFALKFMYGLHQHQSTLPAWWSAKHKDDPDILLRNCKGETGMGEEEERGGKGAACVRQFNYWNPEVLAAQKAFLQGVVDVLASYDKKLPERVAYIDMAQEAWIQLTGTGGVWETGYNKTAIEAFRKYLKDIYGGIESLNAKWGSSYGNFDEIQPPEDYRLKPRPVPTGLTYEFERFRHKSWADWLRQCNKWIREKLPNKNTPNECDISYPTLSCRDAIEGFDSLKLFEAFDIVMEHYQLRFAKDTSVYRYVENLRQALNATTGIGEWYVGGPGEVFDERALLNDMLRQTFQQAQWGRGVLVYWGGHDNNFLLNGNWTEWRLGNTVLRYHAAYVPLGIARARAHQSIFLECPLVEPEVGIVESETSFYNVMGVRGGLGEFSELLFSKGHDFGFLFERLIMDGRQKLDNYKVLILPNALSLPADFTKKLLAWVAQGGVLFATGPAGLWNEYGRENALLLDGVIGKGNWNCEGRVFKLKDKMPDTAERKMLYRKDMSFLVEGRVGKGKVYVRQGSVPTEMVYGIVSAIAPRQFYGEGGKFHLAMRKGNIAGGGFLSKMIGGGKDNLYLSVLNPDCYQTLEDEIVLAGEHKDVADLSCDFPITPVVKDGTTRFKVRLAPAEGIMIRIAK